MAETIEYRRPWMYEKQERAFFCDARYSVTEASSLLSAIAFPSHLV